MNILMPTNIFPPDMGGPASYVPAMARSLAGRGHSVTVLTTSEPEHLNAGDSEYPFEVMRMNRRRFLPFRHTAYLTALMGSAREKDVVFANGLFEQAALFARFSPVPVVMKIVSDEAWERASRKGWTRDGFEDFQHRNQDPAAAALQKIRTLYSRSADGIIAHSEFLADRIAAWGVPRKKITVIHNACRKAPPVDPIHFPGLEGKVVAATACRLIPLKRLDKVLKTMVYVKEMGLVVMGDGRERRPLSELAASLGIAHRVVFTGQLDTTALFAHLAACDFFILNSTHEGFPFVLLEAMTAGLPVISTPVGGVPELIRHNINGLLLNSADEGNDPDVLAGVFQTMIRSADTRQRLASGAQKTARSFSENTMVDQTEAVLQSFVKQGRSPCSTN